MSKCSYCLQRLCRKHPLQDHGERAAKIKAQVTTDSTATMQKSTLDLIKAQISTLQAEKSSQVEEEAVYKLQMDQERELAERRGKRKLSTKEELEVSTSRLNPSVVKLMMGTDGSDDDSDSGSEDTEKKSSKKAKRKEKKEKKEKKDKKEKKAKKRKSEKKTKKEKKLKHNSRSPSRSQSSSSDES